MATNLNFQSSGTSLSLKQDGQEKTCPYLREATGQCHDKSPKDILSISTSPKSLIPVSYSPNQPLPKDAFSWLVEHLSREGDTVVNIDSTIGSAFVAALKGNAVWISSVSSECN